MRSRIGLTAGLAVALLATFICPRAKAAEGFGQIAGPGGCLVESGSSRTSSCGAGEGIFHPQAVAVSPDGTNVYVVGGVRSNNVAESFGAIGILKRNPTTGEVTDIGCLSSDGTDGRDGASGLCTPSPGLLGADGVAVAPDGRSVFITASSSGSIVAFSREPATGALSRLGCLQVTPRPGSPCTAAHLFTGAETPITNASGSALYLTSALEGAIAGLAAPAPSTPEGASVPAEAGTGAPAPAGVASLFTTTPGPVNLNSCIATNGDDGACATGVAMKHVEALALGPEGKQLYAAASESGAVDVFTPGAAAALTQTGCLMASPPPGLCTGSRLLHSPSELAVTPDGRNLYVADTGSTGAKIDVLARNATTGQLSDGSCVDHLPAPESNEGNEEGEEEPEERAEREREKKQEKEEAAADPCTRVPGLEELNTVAVGGGGSAVYAFGNNSAASFSRDLATGALTETACAAVESEASCAVLPDLKDVQAAAVSPDGHNVYVVTDNKQALLAFGIGPAITGTAGTSSGSALVRVACPSHVVHGCRGRVVFTRMLRRHSGRRHRAVLARIVVGHSHSFKIAPGAHPTVLVRLAPAARSFLHRHRRMRVTASVHAAWASGGSGLGTSLRLQLRR